MTNRALVRLSAAQLAMPDQRILTECPLCGEDVRRDRKLAGYEKAHITRCGACGFVFSIVDPTIEKLAEQYAHYNYSAEDDRRTAISMANERALVERLSAWRKTRKVLDVAAGAGRFLVHFRELGFDCYATEFDEEMCRFLEAKGFTTYRGGLDPVGAPLATFDLIIFTEIIEHNNTPRPILANLYRLLRPGGALFITTPNWNSLERRILKGKWGMVTWPEHLTYWTPYHLHRALSEAGLEKISLRAHNISPYRIMQAIRARRQNSDREATRFSDAAQIAVARNPLLRVVKWVLNYGLIVTELGSSIEALYQRPLSSKA